MGAFLLASAAHAQDLSWTELETLTEQPQLATTVKMVVRSAPKVPNEIKKLSEIAYAEVRFTTDSKGVLVTQLPLATSPWLLQAVQKDTYDVKPVKAQKEAGTEHGTRCFLIFNPASAAPGLADSTPRALAVRSVVFPAKLMAKQNKGRSSQELPTGVFADVAVDGEGKVTAVSPVGLAEPDLVSAIVTTLTQWRFAPARREGSSIATSSLRVPILFTWPDLFILPDLSTHPRVIKQEHPVYPYLERASGFQGEVTVDFVVTSTGDVEAAQVYQSNNPNFNESALEAVRKWKFKPGLVGNRPVSVRMRVPMMFNLDGGGRDQYGVTKKGSKLLPPELQNDYLPRVKNAVQGVYPFEELVKGTRAKVVVKFAVEPNGQVTFSDGKDQVLSNFERAARAMIQEFEFIPASKDGKPNWGLLTMEVAFDSGNDQVPVSSSAEHIVRELRKKDPAIVRADQVDQKVAPLVSRAPKFPSSLAKAQADGRALIEFFIDQEGLVQLPRVISATDPSFGYAGAQTMSHWRFSPPTKGGKKVIVKARMPFVFSVTPSSSDAAQLAPASSN